MVVARKIAYNVLVSTTGKILSTILALVGIGLITRYLGKEGFGYYAIALAFFSLFGAVADLGIYSVTTREISRPKANETEIMGKIFPLRIVVSLVVFILGIAVTLFLPYPAQVKSAIMISAAAFVFSSSYMVLNGIFQKNLSMDKVAISELTGKIVNVSFIFAAIHYNLGFIAVMNSLLISMVVNFVLVFLWSRRYLKFKINIDVNYWRKFLKESLPVGVSFIVTFVYFKMDTILLSLFKSSADVGIYNAAYKVIENLSFFPGMIIGLVLPIMSHSVFSNKQKFTDISNKILKLFFILVVPLIVGTLFLANGIVGIIGGAEFQESGNVLRILILALAFIFFGNITNAMLIVGNLQKKLMYALTFCAIFNVSLNLAMIPKFSYTGAAVTSAITEFIVVTLTAFLIVKYLDYKPKIDCLWQVFFSGVIMALFLLFFKDFNFFVLLFVSTAIYFFILWIVKGVTTREIKGIIKREKGGEIGIV
jgi:O-antigen/teichoic acid export membrane protein